MDEKLAGVNKLVAYIDVDKNTSLHYAAACGKLDEVVTELENGNEIDPVNYLGWTPLMMATRNGHVEIVKLILEKRADSTKINKFGYNILLMAVASQKLGLLQLVLRHLLSGGVSKKTMEMFFSPISLAILFNNVSMVQYLIDQEFSLSISSVLSGMTCENFAIKVGDHEIYNLIMPHVKRPVIEIQPPKQEQHECLKHKIYPHQAVQPNDIQQPPVSPLIMFGAPLMNSQAQPCYNFVPNPYLMLPRRCSDMVSPIFSPNISPFTPNSCMPQVFFPQNFSPNHQFVHSVSPMAVFPNDDMNQRIMHNGSYYIPVHSPYNGVYQ